MRRWQLGLVVMALLLALAAWRLMASGENAVGEVVREPAPAVVAIEQKLAHSLAHDVGDAGVSAVKGPGKTIALFGWGPGDRQLGRDRPQEGNPEAPMSVTVDSKGTTTVLDQVNKRLVRIDKNGQPLPSVELPLQAPQDVAVAKDGTTVVMDRLVDKSIAVIGADGKQKGELPLIGKGLREGGASTGVFIDGDGVVVERTHGDSVRIGSTEGVRDDARPEVPGRPTRDGLAYLTASLVTGAGGAVMLTVIDAKTRAHRFTRQYAMPGGAVRALMLLDSDAHGVVYLGAAMRAPEVVQIICVDALDGHPLGVTQVPSNTSADETFREFAVSDDGQIVALLRSEQGAELRSYSCP